MKKIMIVDENDHPIGSASQDEARAKGLGHRIVRVILKDENGLILLQKRSFKKAIYPNRWTDSASGHVDENENYEDAMARELFEELGIKANLKFVGKFSNSHTDDRVVSPVFNAVFEGNIAHNKALMLGEDEVSEARWVSLDEVLSEIKEYPEQFTPGFIHTIKFLYDK